MIVMKIINYLMQHELNKIHEKRWKKTIKRKRRKSSSKKYIKTKSEE